jgi:uncharacterized protein (DUF1778 family)
LFKYSAAEFDVPTTLTKIRAKPARSERLEARISKEQKQLFTKAAALDGCSLSEFVVSSAQEAARKTIKEHETLALSARDQEIFVAALLDDTPPGDRLRQAARRYLEHKEP